MLKINLCSLTHNLIYSTYKVPFAIQGLFIQNKNVHSYDTRNKNDIHFKHISIITYGKKTISYKGGRHWNNLTSDLKHVKSLKNFKRLLKSRLFQHLIDTAVVFNFAVTFEMWHQSWYFFCSVSVISVVTFCNIFMLLYIMHVFLLTIALIGLAFLYGALFYRFFVKHSRYCKSLFISLVLVNVFECRK